MKEIDKNIDSSINELNCEIHASAKGDFFCINCRQIICKHCFVNNHKTHNSNVPGEIIKSVLDKLNNSLSENDKQKSHLTDILNAINSQSKSLQHFQDDISKESQRFKNSISNEINSNLKALLLEYVSQNFGKLGTETEKLYTKIDNTIAINKEFLDELGEIKEDVDKIEASDSKHKDYDLCKYIASELKDLNFLNSENKDNSADNQLINQLESVKQSVHLTNNQFHVSFSGIEKDIQNYQNMVNESINLGASNMNFFLRRFNHFNHPDDKKSLFFKKSYLKLAVEDDIYLSGINLCGLHKGEKPINISIELLEISNNTRESLSSEHKSILKENFSLKAIQDEADPVSSYFFNLPVFIKSKDRASYLLVIENLTSEQYVKIFTGNATLTDKFFYLQELQCNTTEVKFTFSRPKNINSDFDELTAGILSDVIFSVV